MEMSIQAKAYNDYIKGMKYADIAAKYNVSLNTVKSWKQRHGWTRKKGAHPKKRGAPFLNKNAVGNSGGPGAPKGSQRALKHGLFAKYLPPETLSIVMDIQDASPLDILWANIQLKYTAIIRAQKLMYVADAEDHTILTQSTSVSMDPRTGQKTGVSKTRNIHIAADKEATFLQSQSRAMNTLTNMIKQYEELLLMSPKEEQRLRIEKLKAEISNLYAKDKVPDKPDISAYINALKAGVKGIWNDE